MFPHALQEGRPPAGEVVLRASWLGHWRAPWPLARGRRWGDAAWTLAALGQAWLLGGGEGRWPRLAWEAKHGPGPHPAGPPDAWAEGPDPAWVALLRHGSAKADPERPGPKEDPRQCWAWERLLQGDGAPWMALGTVLLDLPERLRWIAPLGAVEADGTLRLPPFLEALVPPALRRLPPEWWETLLGAQDAEGRLLPAGAPPGDVDLGRLLAADALAPLWLEQPPEGLPEDSPHLHRLPDGRRVLAPRLRAWGRAPGACPEALARLLPTGLAFGQAPRAPLTELLEGRAPAGESLPPGWEPALARDLEAGLHTGTPPESGDPVLDRLRVRWGGALPPPAEGYPAWGVDAHPCADPFHWMAEGLRAFHASDLEKALHAFGWSHAHFQRLGSPFWAARSAANAAQAALLWGDPEIYAWWLRTEGPQPSPYGELQEAQLLELRGDAAGAERLLRELASRAPELEQPWMHLGGKAVETGNREGIREALAHLEHPEYRLLLEAALAGFPEAAPMGFHPELALFWSCHRACAGREPVEAFWTAWEACSNRAMRLECGLRLAEAIPASRAPARLLELQVLVQRGGNAQQAARLKALWPAPGQTPAESPEAQILAWLAARPFRAWILAGGSPLGPGGPPPEAVLARMQAEGELPPCLLEDGRVWWGFPLQWQGASVGSALVALPREASLEACAELALLAPWVAELAPRIPPPPEASEGELLADGSEPMASLLAELRRVAPSELPVLLLGPTGSGKELAARELHRQSARYGPLVPVNVCAFAEGLLESELFGHVKGAFTGADRTRGGAIEAADGGTLFLDEVADLSPRLQSLFLRVLQEREVRKVGDQRAVKVDVRFVAATHKDLEALAERGLFRRDLLYRLQGAVLTLPALRERRHEMPFLLPRLVGRLAAERGRPAPPVAPGLAQALARLPWPGNFRELVHTLERTMLRCGNAPLTPAHFPELQAPGGPERTWAEATRAFQRRLLRETLQRHGYRIAESAEALGLTRAALYATAKRLDVDVVAERMERRTDATTAQ